MGYTYQLVLRITDSPAPWMFGGGGGGGGVNYTGWAFITHGRASNKFFLVYDQCAAVIEFLTQNMTYDKDYCWHFDLKEIAWHQPQIRIVGLMWNVMDGRGNWHCQKLKIHNRIYKNASFFNTLPEISYDFQGIHNFIVNLWKLYVCSINCCCYHEKCVTRRWITTSAIKQMAKWCDSRCSM